jgi:hypothetical protein
MCVPVKELLLGNKMLTVKPAANGNVQATSVSITGKTFILIGWYRDYLGLKAK